MQGFPVEWSVTNQDYRMMENILVTVSLFVLWHYHSEGISLPSIYFNSLPKGQTEKVKIEYDPSEQIYYSFPYFLPPLQKSKYFYPPIISLPVLTTYHRLLVIGYWFLSSLHFRPFYIPLLLWAVGQMGKLQDQEWPKWLHYTRYLSQCFISYYRSLTYSLVSFKRMSVLLYYLPFASISSLSAHKSFSASSRHLHRDFPHFIQPYDMFSKFF
jgi:hypothetical protein